MGNVEMVPVALVGPMSLMIKLDSMNFKADSKGFENLLPSVLLRSHYSACKCHVRTKFQMFSSAVSFAPPMLASSEQQRFAAQHQNVLSVPPIAEAGRHRVSSVV